MKKKTLHVFFLFGLQNLLQAMRNLHGSIVFSANNSVEVRERCEQGPYYINLGKDAPKGGSNNKN